MRIHIAAGILGVMASTSAWAQQATPTDDMDLARIPAAAASETEATQASPLRMDIDTALSIADERTVPGQTGGDEWTARSSLEGHYETPLSAQVSITLSGRINVEGQTQEAVHPLGVDWREAYISWGGPDQFFVNIGRINLTDGVALGYSPTDFFRAGSSVSQSSSDPSTLRNDRLGSVMVRFQKLWPGASLSLALSPKLENPTAVPLSADNGAGLLLGRTNSSNRVLLQGSFSLGEWSPEMLLYNDAGKIEYGLNLSHPIGNSIVFYSSWAGGRGPGVVKQAVQFGAETESLPDDLNTTLELPRDVRFSNDLSVGASWAGAQHWTVNLEYHLHQSGLSSQQLHDWVAASIADPNESGLIFYYIRAYSQYQQEPLAKQEAFVRVSGVDMLIRNLNFTGFAFLDQSDGSGFAQMQAAYNLDRHWTFSIFVNSAWGARDSNYGTIPERDALALEVVRYF